MKNQNWFLNNNFWNELSPMMFNKTNISKAKKEVNSIIKHFQIQKNVNILDIGCGIGRHTIEFAKYGINALGIDANSDFIEIARKKVKKKNLPIEFITVDMRTYKPVKKFTYITILYNTFGYFKSEQENFNILKNCFSFLEKDGVIIIEMKSKESVLGNYSKISNVVINDHLFLIKREIKNGNVLVNRWEEIKSDRSYIQEIMIYDKNEIKKLLLDCGFKKVFFYQNYNFSLAKDEKWSIIAASK